MQEAKYLLEVWSALKIHITFRCRYLTVTSIWDFKEHVSPEYRQQCETVWDRYRKNYRNNPFWMMHVKKIGGLYICDVYILLSVFGANRPGP